MPREQGPDPRMTLLALIAWVISWVGDHDWSALLRLVVLVFAFAVAGAVLLGAIYLVHGV